MHPWRVGPLIGTDMTIGDDVGHVLDNPFGLTRRHWNVTTATAVRPRPWIDTVRSPPAIAADAETIVICSGCALVIWSACGLGSLRTHPTRGRNTSTASLLDDRPRGGPGHGNAWPPLFAEQLNGHWRPAGRPRTPAAGQANPNWTPARRGSRPG